MNASPRANVLLVDDKPENLLALESILNELDQNLVSATSAREALRFLLLEDVALVLLDVQMPGLNGFEFAELIRERERTQHTPIIFISALSTDNQYVFRGYSLGAVDYLAKPVEPEILRSKVRFFTKLYLQKQEIVRQAAMLEEANQRLDNINAELEDRVKLRTLQLRKANRELQSEIATRKRSEVRLFTEHAITRVLSAAEDASNAMPHILKLICELMNAEVAFLWQLDDAGTHLTCEYAETMGGRQIMSTLINRSVDMKLGRGSAGRSAESKDSVMNLEIEFDPRNEEATVLGLSYSSAFPIMIGSEFFGAIEFFTAAPCETDGQLINTLDAIGGEIGQYFRRKRAENDREQLLSREKLLREEAEHASLLKDEFLATVSHELRTPLNSILGWGQLLTSDKLPADARQNALEAIFRNARSQAQLIEDLLDASRLISGKLVLNLSPTNVVKVIESAIDVVRPSAESKKISIEFKNEEPDISLVCDSLRLQQMLLNLLTNAVKFTPAGGFVSVECIPAPGELSITVTDTGKGIATEFLPYVFERFRQADSSSTRAHDGLGLGLAIVRQLASLHGGTAIVTSEGAGKGSAFTLKFPSHASGPVIVSAGETRSKPPVRTHHVEGINVLIVDDDSDAREMLAYALGMQGAVVKISSSADEALKTLSAEPPDILVSDINMPDEDGYSLLRRIRSLSGPISEIPAIALTAMARSEDSERALEAGFQIHIPKPIQIDDLVAAIGGLLHEVKFPTIG